MLDDNLAIPTSDNYKVCGNAEDLRKALVIETPKPPEETPPSLLFQRKRDIEIPWRKVFTEIESGVEESVEALRFDFEQSVGFGATPLTQITQADIDKLKTFYKDLTDVGESPFIVFKPDFDDQQKEAKTEVKVSAAPVKSGVVFQHGSGRSYLVLPVEGEAFTAADFATPAGYQSVWRDKISGIELVYLSQDEALQNSSEFEEIDLSARLIEEKFQELIQLKAFQVNLLQKADPVINTMLEQAAASGLELNELERLQNKALQLKMADYQIDKRIKRLVNQANELGYLLFDKDQEPFPLPDGSTIEAKAGYLYRKYKRTAKWSTTQTVNRTVRKVLKFLFVKVKVKRVVKQQVQKQHSKIVEDYQLVDTSKDLLEDKVIELRRLGYKVNVFRETAQSYISQDNVSLESVMEECGRNESVRLETAVVLPIYEESMTGDKVLVKYHVFKKPLPGIQPNTMPRLTLIESLSYRLAWVGSRLGELVNSLNLAPGESRTITIRKEYERESTVTESRSSIFDLDRQESNDLADEIENQMRRESEHSDETSMSVEVKGSYGFVSGSANASHGSKNSLKNFSQGINKVARKSSQAINKKQREEVSSSSTNQVKVSTFDETEAKIENINQGRTLNLMFYRIFNRFKSGLFVEGLRFQVISSTEIIAGSGIQKSATYSFDSFQDMMGEFSDIALPMHLPDAVRYQYLNNVLNAIFELINNEYRRVEAPKAKSRSKQSFAGDLLTNLALTTVSILSVNEPDFKQNISSKARNKASSQSVKSAKETSSVTKKPAAKNLKSSQSPKVVTSNLSNEQEQAQYDEYQANLKSIAESLRSATLNNEKALEGTEQDLLIVAPGLYLDSSLGVQPATEPYSEDMRAQRVRQEAAEVSLKAAEAQYKLALAQNLLGQSNGASNWIVGIIPDKSSRTLQLKFKHLLPQKSWQFYIDGDQVGIQNIDYITDRQIAISFDNPKNVLTRDDLLTAKVELRDKDSALIIGLHP